MKIRVGAVKRLGIGCLLLLLVWALPATAQKKQSCVGTVVVSEEGVSLDALPDNESLWCGAIIGETVKSPESQRVLGTCAVGDRCRVDGLFVGHGVFYWSEIHAVRKLPLGPPEKIYTPGRGTPERKAIMDDIRLAYCPDVTFLVSHLKVSRRGDKAVVFAEVSDAAKATECGGVLYLESLGTQWRLKAGTGSGGGASTCADAQAVHADVLAMVGEAGADTSIIPESFLQSQKEAVEGAASSDTMCAEASRY